MIETKTHNTNTREDKMITNETLNNKLDMMFNEYGIEFADYNFPENATNTEMIIIIADRQTEIIKMIIEENDETETMEKAAMVNISNLLNESINMINTNKTLKSAKANLKRYELEHCTTSAILDIINDLDTIRFKKDFVNACNEVIKKHC